MSAVRQGPAWGRVEQEASQAAGSSRSDRGFPLAFFPLAAKQLEAPGAGAPQQSAFYQLRFASG